MAKLTSAWWAKTKPAKYKGGLEKALKEFEAAVRRGNGVGALSALATVRTQIGVAGSDLEGLLKLQKVKLKTMKIELAEMDKLAEREASLIVRKGTKQIKVWGRDFGNAVAEKAGGKAGRIARVKGGAMEVKLDLTSIHALENSGTEARFLRELNDMFDAEVDKLCKQIKEAIDNSGGVRLTAGKRATLTANAANSLKKLKVAMVAQAGKTVEAATAHHKAAKEFKKQRAIAVTTASLAVIGSGAAMALPGTTAVAIVGLIRSVAKLTEELVNLFMKLETKYKSVLAQIQLLGKSFDKGKRDLKAMGKVTVNALIGADVMVTYTAAGKRLDDFLNTISVLADRVSKTQLKIIATISKLDELTKIMKKSAHDAAQFAKTKAGREMANLEKNLDKMLDKASDTMGRVVQAERQAPGLIKAFKQLGDNSTTVERAEKLIPACINIAFAVGSFGDGVAASQQVALVTVNSVSCAQTIADELISMGD